jgi:GR25 family glycosyltransferase involved in LPS biosynthesis
MRCEAQLKRLNVDFKFVKGKITQPYILGCHNGHKSCVEKALEDKAKNVLIFEDDFLIINYNATLLSEALESLPSNWQRFSLGGPSRCNYKNKKSLVHSRTLVKCAAVHNQAYALNSSTFESVINWKYRGAHISQQLAGLPENYTLTPHMVIQFDEDKPHRTMAGLRSYLQFEHLSPGNFTPYRRRSLK